MVKLDAFEQPNNQGPARSGYEEGSVYRRNHIVSPNGSKMRRPPLTGCVHEEENLHNPRPNVLWFLKSDVGVIPRRQSLESSLSFGKVNVWWIHEIVGIEMGLFFALLFFLWPAQHRN